MKARIKCYYTNDYEQAAMDEVETMLKNEGFILEGELKKTDSKRACRNAYGKELDENEFDAIAPDEDEAWFNDYDFIFECIVSKECDEAEFEKALSNAGAALTNYVE